MGTFIVTVTNEGAVDTGAFKVILMSMDSTFTTRNDDFFATSTGLTAGNSDEFEIDVEIPFTTLPLAYMKVTVDSEDSVVEYDEADNIQMYTIDTAAS
jgi:hypothetical protein